MALISKRFLALLLCVALVASSQDFSHGTSSLPAANGSDPFQIPSTLGISPESYTGSALGHVVLLQDLHVNLDAQNHISEILGLYSKRGLLPPTIGVEGAEGPVDASILAAYPDPKIRAEVADYFVKQGELTGAGAYAVKNGQTSLLEGIENKNYYTLNKRLFQRTFSARNDVIEQLNQLEQPLSRLTHKHYTRPLRQLRALETHYLAGRLSQEDYRDHLLQFAKKSGFALAQERYLALSLIMQAGFPQTPSAAFLTETDKELRELNVDLKKQFASEPTERNLVQIEQDLRLCKGLLDQQLAENEVGEISADLPWFLRSVQAMLDISDVETAHIQETIRSAVDYYALAIVREKPMFDHAISLLEKSPNKTAIIVAGGFHTKGLTDRLRAQRISYTVITPRVDLITPEEHALYQQRLLDHHLSDVQEEPSAAAGSTRAQSLAAGDWILSGNPVARRVALGRLTRAVYQQIKIEHGDWETSQIAAELQQRLARHPRLSLTPQQLADFVHTVVVAPEVEQPRLEQEGHWRLVLSHVNRTAFQWIARTLGAVWLWAHADKLAAHRQFNLFSPIPLTIDLPSERFAEFRSQLKALWDLRHAQKDFDLIAENLEAMGELILPVKKGALLMFPELGADVKITAETPENFVRISVKQFRTSINNSGHVRHISGAYLKINNDLYSLHDSKPILRPANNLDEIVALEKVYWHRVEGISVPTSSEIVLEKALKDYFATQEKGEDIGPASQALTQLGEIYIRSSGDHITLSPDLTVRMSTIDGDLKVTFHLKSSDPRDGVYVQLTNRHGTARVAELYTPVTPGYYNSEELNGLDANQKRLDRLGVIYRQWRNIGRDDRNRTPVKNPMPLLKAMQSLGDIPAVVEAKTVVNLGIHLGYPIRLMVPSLSEKNVILRVRPLYYPDGKPGIYIEVKRADGVTSYHLPDPDQKTRFLTFPTHREMMQAIQPRYEPAAFGDLLKRYVFARDYKESAVIEVLDVVNAGPQQFEVKNGRGFLKDDPKLASASFLPAKAAKDGHFVDIPDGLYEATPHLINENAPDLGFYFQLPWQTLSVNEAGNRLTFGSGELVQINLREKKKSEWLSRRLKVYMDDYAAGTDLAEASRILVAIPPTPLPYLARGIQVGDRSIQTPTAMSGPILAKVHYLASVNPSGGIYLELVDQKGKIVYALPTGKDIISYEDLQDLVQAAVDNWPKHDVNAPGTESKKALETAPRPKLQEYQDWVFTFYRSILSISSENREAFWKNRPEVMRKIIAAGAIPFSNTSSKGLRIAQLVFFSLKSVPYKPGRAALVQAFAVTEGRGAGEDLYFTVDIDGKKLFVRQHWMEGSQWGFLTSNSYEEMMESHASDRPDPTRQEPKTLTEDQKSYSEWVLELLQLRDRLFSRTKTSQTPTEQLHDLDDTVKKITDLHRQMVEKGPTQFRTQHGRIPFQDSHRLKAQFSLLDTPKNSEATVTAYYLNESNPLAGIYFKVTVGDTAYFIREVPRESRFNYSRSDRSPFRTYRTLEELRASISKNILDSDAMDATSEDVGSLSADAEQFSDWIVESADLRYAVQRGETEKLPRLIELYRNMVEKGPIISRTQRYRLFPRPEGSDYYKLGLGRTLSGKRATLTARYFDKDKPAEGVYFIVNVEGIDFFIRPVPPLSHKLNPEGRGVLNFPWFQTHDTFDDMIKAHKSELEKFSPKKKRNKDVDAAVEVFTRYKLLDLATALSNNPEEFFKSITVLLSDKPEITEPPLRKISMAYLLNLQEGGDVPAGVRAKPGDSTSVLDAMMRLRDEIERMGEHQQNLFVQTFIRVSFQRIARDPERALAEIEAQLESYPDTPLKQHVLEAVRILVHEALRYQPAHIRTEMKPHQRVGAWTMRQSDRLKTEGIHGFLLEDDTRLGKTIQFFAAFNPAWKGMVTMPAGVLETWQKQGHQHTDGSIRIVAVKGTPEEKRAILTRERHQKGVILLISNESLRNFEDADFEALNDGLDTVGVDEAQTIENYHGEGHHANSDQAEAVHRLRPQRFWFMSATPYTSRPDQLYSALRLLHRDPTTGEITNPLFATREAFRAWANSGKGGLTALFVMKSRLSLRRTKADTGGLYSKKVEIDPAQEGQYELTFDQSDLILRIIKNLGQYLKRYNLKAPVPYDVKSISRFLKLYFLSLAQVDPAFLGETAPTNFWKALDAIVDSRLKAGKKGNLIAQDREVVDAVFEHYRKKGLRVARLDGDVQGWAKDESGQPLFVRFENGKMIVGKTGDRLSAQGYQQYLFNEDPDVALIVMNANAGRGIDLSRADFEVLLQPAEHYVQYYQASDRAIGLDPDPQHPKTVEVLRMTPTYPQKFIQAAQAAGDGERVEHGSPVQLFDEVIFGDQKKEFDQVVQGVKPSSALGSDTRAASLVHSLFVANDPSMKRKKIDPTKLGAASVFYPVYRNLVRQHADSAQALSDLSKLIEKLEASGIEARPLAAALAAYPEMNPDDLSYITALLEISNKYYRDRMLRLLPDLYRHLKASQQSIATLAETGPPGLQLLAAEQPELVIPFIAATHAWENSPTGWHVWNDVLDDILADGLSHYEAQLAARHYVHSLIPLIDLNQTDVLDLMARVHSGFLDDALTLQDRILFLEELSVLKVSDPVVAREVIRSHDSFAALRTHLHETLFQATLKAFDLEPTPEVRERLWALTQRWGSLQIPMRLLAKLESGDPSMFSGHVALFKRTFRHIVMGTYTDYRNAQSVDRAGPEIDYKKDDPAFWNTFTEEQTVELGDVTVAAPELLQALARQGEVIEDLLTRRDILEFAIGNLQERVSTDLADPETAFENLGETLREIGQRRAAASADQRPDLDVQLRDLALRLKIVQLKLALMNSEDPSVLRDRLNAVKQALESRLGENQSSSVLYQTIRSALVEIDAVSQARVFKEVSVQFTSDPDLIMRRGMLEEDLIDCFNLDGDVRQVATLVDDLVSRNKILAIVRVNDSIVSRSMVKVRQTEDHRPVLHIERPLFRRGYGFEKEIVEALSRQKAPAMQVQSVTRYQYPSDSAKDSIELYPTGTRAPSEYHESLFNWRLRDQAVHHRATVVVKLDIANSRTVTPVAMTPGLRRLLQRGGTPLPSLWKQSWIAGFAEYKLTRDRARFVARHHPENGLQRMGLNVIWGAIWAGTLIAPAAFWTIAAALGVLVPVAGIGTAIIWVATQKYANIVTHGLIDVVSVAVKRLIYSIQERRVPSRELARLERAIGDTPAFTDSVGIGLTPSASQETRRLIAESADAPSRSRLVEAYARIAAAA